jgi:hypothetical protein
MVPSSGDLWRRWVETEERRKAHMNGAAVGLTGSIVENGSSAVPPPVWGGWGQQRPRVRVPPALGRMGFPFVPPKPPPSPEDNRRMESLERTRSPQSLQNPPHPPAV